MLFLDMSRERISNVKQMSLEDGVLRHVSDIWKASVKRGQNSHKRSRNVHSRTDGPFPILEGDCIVF